MSRTYRTKPSWKYDAYGRLWTHKELDAAGLSTKYTCVPGPNPNPISEWMQLLGITPRQDYHFVVETFGHKGLYVIDRRARDRKTWDKPPKWYKQMKRRIERARMRDAMNQHKPLPVFKRSDQWDWT